MHEFVVGQKVRCVMPNIYSKTLIKGHVYTVAAIDNMDHVIVEGSPRKNDPERFVPFEWQTGDKFKIVKAGCGLSKEYVGKTGVLTTRNVNSEDCHKTRCWWTDMPHKYNEDYFYYVGESIIEFVQPGTEETINIPPSLDAPTQKPVKALRYLNRTST
jgi:hypothetical protein